jgi:pyruvate dehydrogenase E1 component beta subunit
VTTLTYRQVLHDTLAQEMTRDERVFLMGEEIGVFEGSYKVTKGLLEQFGAKRVKDTPIAEEGFVGAAVGAAMLGLRPVVELMTINFSIVALDMILNHAAKIYYMFGGQTPVPMVIRTPGGGGQQLAATHSQNLEVFFSHIPGLKVVAPATPYDARGLLRSAIRDDDPVLFLENLGVYDVKGEVPDEDFDNDYTIPIGVADIKRNGSDITLITYSRMVHIALEVAEQMQHEGISCEVVDLRSLRPLDVPTILQSVRKTNRAVIFEHDWRSYGIGAEIAAVIQEEAFDYLDAPVLRVAAAEVPLPYSKPMELAAMPNGEQLASAIRKTVSKRW